MTDGVQDVLHAAVQVIGYLALTIGAVLALYSFAP